MIVWVCQCLFAKAHFAKLHSRLSELCGVSLPNVQFDTSSLWSAFISNVLFTVMSVSGDTIELYYCVSIDGSLQQLVN